jgi:hypothetical protein
VRGLLLPYLPPRPRRYGLAFLGVAAVLTLATWPQTLRQIEIVLNFPRPLRLDYLLLVWAAVPWLWSQPWPRWPWPPRPSLSRDALSWSSLRRALGFD